jgi:predicted phage-related endonuclease
MPKLTTTRDRSTYMGATDVADLATGAYRTPFEIYLEKIGELDPAAQHSQDDLDRFERGHRLEDVALDWHAEITGIQVERIRRDVVHPRLPFVIVHPDARVKPWRQTRRLIEVKTSARKWDEVPQRTEAQVQMQIAAAGADVADVVVLGFDGPPVPFEVPRNDELIAALEDLTASFWDRVQRREPPPLDGSRATSRWLDRLFREGPEERADDSQAQAIARLLAIRAQMKALEAEDGELVNALKFSMAGGSRMYAPGVGRVVWTAPSSRTTVAWKEVASAYRVALEHARDELRHVVNVGNGATGAEVLDRVLSDQAGTTSLDDLEALYTTVVDGLRTFRVTPAKPAPEESVA